MVMICTTSSFTRYGTMYGVPEYNQDNLCNRWSVGAETGYETSRMTNTLLTLHDPAAARRYYAAGLWRADTLYTLLARHAAERPEAHALRDGTRRLTWSALLTLVDAVAADLDGAGVKRGERVAVWLPNRVEAVAVL